MNVLARRLVVAGAAAAAVFCQACRNDTAPLGLPEAYSIVAPLRDQTGQIQTIQTGGAGLPVVVPITADDAATAPLHKLFFLGFVSEVLRTDYLAKQFLREADLAGATFSPAARQLANEPTVFLVDDRAGDPAIFASPGLGLAVKRPWTFGGPSPRPTLTWIGVPAALDRDPALGQTVVAALGRHIARAIATGGDPRRAAEAPAVLVDGYAQSLEVIAREWRLGEGPQGAMAPTAGTTAQRELFAAVRGNRFAVGPDGHGVRPASQMLRDPGLAATVLYRFAQAKVVGHRVASAELYGPFVKERVPPGISPAAVLGPFRNFQAKLIAVWGRAVLRGKPPRDIVDLVEDYAAELPAERSEAIRLFVITTFGATVKEGGVVAGLPAPGKSASKAGTDILPELTALAAEVAAGRRSLRQALVNR
ncbi:MAG: hypothetical protein QOI66_2502 [Myxococcales bacterium]|nr:hypothetical protein [Myxococcales bacterium]